MEEITHNENSDQDAQSETSATTTIQAHVPGELVEQPPTNYPESLCSYVSLNLKKKFPIKYFDYSQPFST